MANEVGANTKAKASLADGLRVRPPAISPPTGGGAIPGMGETFAVDPLTGGGAMSVPITTSPGRSGFGPALALSHASGNGNGPFGLGWRLSLPAITRKSGRGLPRYQDDSASDVFILSGAEDLAPSPPGGDDPCAPPTRALDGKQYRIACYRPRVEGLFAKIERWTNLADPGDVVWFSISKDNILSVYGKDENSRIVDPGDARRIFSWLLCETRDDKGNALVCQYKPEDGAGVDLASGRGAATGPGHGNHGNRYVKRILYGNRVPLLAQDGGRPRLLTPDACAAAGWMFEVVFDYGEHDEDAPQPGDDPAAPGAKPWALRDDSFSTYRPGFEVRTHRLCKRVLMFHHFPDEQEIGAACLVRSHDFTYSYSRAANAGGGGAPGHALLASVRQRGHRRLCGGSGAYLSRALPPLEFFYGRARANGAGRGADGQGPHLLVRSVNNLGAETRIGHASSAKFQLQDKRDGRPWTAKLPFPVHVVERVEIRDHIGKNRFVSRYAYHDGHFDGVENEFCGFAMVEQWDGEELALVGSGAGGAVGAGGAGGKGPDAASHVPTVLTKTWFHTGACHDGVKGATQTLPDSLLPCGFAAAGGIALTPDERREARRALKGAVLRQEVYGIDGGERQGLPYGVVERNYTVVCLQPRGGGRNAVFLRQPRETLDFRHERTLYLVGGRRVADPRIGHTMALECDAFGNVLKSIAIAYGRCFDDPDPLLGVRDRAEQRRILATCAESQYTNAIFDDDDHRAPLIAESRVYEILRLEADAKQPGVANLLSFAEAAAKLRQASDGGHDLAHGDIDARGADQTQVWRRLIERVRTLYRDDALTALLPAKTLQRLALPGECYQLAFTDSLLDAVFRRKRQDGALQRLLVDSAALLGQGGGEGAGYVDLDGDGAWWVASGRGYYYPPGGDESAPAELAHARRHFFLPTRYRDPFYTRGFASEARVTYDRYDLLVQETRDALGNLCSAGERDDSGAHAAAGSGIDYRVLQPRLVTDPNGNRIAVAFDALGLVAGTAVMGKNPEFGFVSEGDLLDGRFVADPTPQQIADFMARPHEHASALLGGASSRIIYALDCFGSGGLPVFAATLTRETHLSELASNEEAGPGRIQLGFSYSDGFGREIQQRTQAAPPPTANGGAQGPARRAAGGWAVLDKRFFNRQGGPACQCQPFFSATHRFELAIETAVGPVLFHDPFGRVVATLRPDATYSKLVCEPWRQAAWDANDTVLLDPRSDPDVAATVAAHFAARPPGWATWLQQRADGPCRRPDAHGIAAEIDAALAHAGTPALSFFDALGRAFLGVADNGVDQSGAAQQCRTRVKFDIEGNRREVVDDKNRVVMRNDVDMLGKPLHQAGMDAGRRWMLANAAGNPLCAWDGRDHRLRTVYDQLRRPLGTYLQNKPGGMELQVEYSVFGESVANPQSANLRGRLAEVHDQAGLARSHAYDFKGMLLQGGRQLARAYKSTRDWSNGVVLDARVFVGATAYDALGRPVTLTMPDGSVIRPSYNEANLLKAVTVDMGGVAGQATLIVNIDYNAGGQRTLIEYGNGVATGYDYDALTCRLTRVVGTRGGERVRDLHYFYDPVGNICHIRDDARQTICLVRQGAEPGGDCLLGGLYGASGRTDPGAALAQNGDKRWSEPCQHDAHGNMVATSMHWYDKAQLRQTDLAGGGTAYYVVDGAGQLVRKVWEKAPGLTEERVYLGAFELFRRYAGPIGPANLTLVRETLHIVDDAQCIATVETRGGDAAANDPVPAHLLRYQFGSHFGPACVEPD